MFRGRFTEVGNEFDISFSRQRRRSFSMSWGQVLIQGVECTISVVKLPSLALDRLPLLAKGLVTEHLTYERIILSHDENKATLIGNFPQGNVLARRPCVIHHAYEKPPLHPVLAIVTPQGGGATAGRPG